MFGNRSLTAACLIALGLILLSSACQNESSEARVNTDPAVSSRISEESAISSTIASAATQTTEPTVTLQPTNTTTPTPSPAPTETPTPTITPTATPTPTPKPYLSEHRLVTYYGSPLGRGLGILGNSPRPEMLADLRQLSEEYQALSDRPVLPTFHMITTVAHTEPPLYSYPVDLAVIEEWVEAASLENVAVILDIQPGRADIIEEIGRIKHLLFLPNVHLAIDPEWMMNEYQIPNVHIGHVTGEIINEIQALLNEIAIETGLNQVLILHQFKDSMIEDKAAISDYPYVELVINSDGAFNADVKKASYLQYATEPGFEYGGIKLFTLRDRRLLLPDEVMGLFPQPAIIIYQ